MKMFDYVRFNGNSKSIKGSIVTGSVVKPRQVDPMFKIKQAAEKVIIDCCGFYRKGNRKQIIALRESLKKCQTHNEVDKVKWFYLDTYAYA